MSPGSIYNSTSRTFSITIADASDLQPSDTIENVTRGGFGKIITISPGNRITASRLIGGSYDDICAAGISGCSSTTEEYRIHYDFIDKREYEFDITIKGEPVDSVTSGLRTRSICPGYDSTCATSNNNATFKGDGNTPWVTIRDSEGGVLINTTTNNISTGGISSRSIKLGNLQFLVNHDTDLPEWFVRNNWHQYVMVAYDNGDAPGGTQCTAGTNCISVNVRNESNDILATRDDVRVVVMMAGDALTGQSWGNATAADYYDEAENTDADELFDRYAESDDYNDVLRIATSCPTDTTKLCWSN